MSKQIQDAYIVAATRLPVGKRTACSGNVRPDDMLAHVLKSVRGAGRRASTRRRSATSSSAAPCPKPSRA